MSLETEIRKKVSKLNIWRSNGQRAPHKPLLILLSLSRMLEGHERLVAFSEIEAPLTELLINYGPPRKQHHPDNPFWHLQYDGLWEITTSGAELRFTSSNDPWKTDLRRLGVKGGFPHDVYNVFRSNQLFQQEVVRALLNGHFPPSMHADILNDLGLSLIVFRKKRHRDKTFRDVVVQAYEHRCAICGYDIKVGREDLALEAAHIKWRAAGGPDDVKNGLALCAIHHKALDRGAIGLTQEHTVLITADLYGGNWVDEWFLQFNGKSIRQPQDPDFKPSGKFVSWHTKEVFRKPARR